MWKDIRAPVAKITINRGLICYMLEETNEREFSVDYVEKCTVWIENQLIKQLSIGSTIQTIPDLILEYTGFVSSGPVFPSFASDESGNP